MDPELKAPRYALYARGSDFKFINAQIRAMRGAVYCCPDGASIVGEFFDWESSVSFSDLGPFMPGDGGRQALVQYLTGPNHPADVLLTPEWTFISKSEEDFEQLVGDLAHAGVNLETLGSHPREKEALKAFIAEMQTVTQ